MNLSFCANNNGLDYLKQLVAKKIIKEGFSKAYKEIKPALSSKRKT